MTLVSTAAKGGSATAGALTLIQAQTLGSAALTIDFSSIPSTYNHLQVVLIGRSDQAATSTNFFVRFNNDATANYNYNDLLGSGGAASATQVLGGTDGVHVGQVAGSTATAGFAGIIVLWIPLYAGTTFQKYLVCSQTEQRDGTASGYQTLQAAGVWLNTAAVNRLTFRFATGGVNFIAGSAAYLYGIN